MGEEPYPVSQPVEAGQHAEISAEPGPVERRPSLLRRMWAAHGRKALLFLTVLSTLFIGYEISITDYIGRHASLPGQMDSWLSWVFYPGFFFNALAYTAALLGFLTAHEMGHYLQCRRYGMQASLPYYLPNPILFGTFGAVIRIRSRIQDRRSLFDIGVSGPLAGFAVAVPLLAFGLLTSLKIPLGSTAGFGEGGSLVLGQPLLLRFFEWLFLSGSGDVHIFMNPLAMVGWFGCLVTAINLLPVSQLDGGHILYAVFGKRHFVVSLLVVAGMVAAGIVTGYYGWLLWALLVSLFGLRHPPLVREEATLGRGRLLATLLALLVFIISFMPVPIEIPELFRDDLGWPTESLLVPDDHV